MVKICSRFLLYYEKFMVFVGISGQGLFYLQAYEIYKTGCSNNVSLRGFVMALLSVICWLIYGFLKKDIVLIIVNIFAVLGSSVAIGTILFYMRN